MESIVLFGTGAMASLVGARLERARPGAVTLAGTWPDALAAIRRRGLTVEEGGDTWRARPRAAALEAAPPADLALVLVKSWRTADVAPHVGRALAAGGLALTLQNGLGNAEALAECVGTDRVLRGVTSTGALLLGPGWVRATGDGPTSLDAAGPAAGRAADVAELLTGAGIAAAPAEDFEPVVWRKLAVNCAINPVSALLGLTNGRLLERADAVLAMGAAAAEAASVAAAAGIRLGADPRALVLEVAYATGENRSSMLQDVERGAPTEIDAINGAVARRGGELGVPTPANDWLVQAVTERAAGRTGRKAVDLGRCPGVGG